MPRFFALLLVAIALLTGSPAASAGDRAAAAGIVSWIYDADTFEIAPHGKVRLLGIDAPEKAASDRDEKFVKLGIARKRLRPVYGEGLAWCLRNIKGQRVTLAFDASQKERRDRHGRRLAYVRLADGRLVNRLLLEQGLVIVYRRFPIELQQDFLAAETEAKQRGLGLWAP